MAKNKWLDFLQEYPANKLTTAQLRQAEKSLSKLVNQRIIRLGRSGVKQTTVTDTLRARMKEIGNLSRSGKVGTREKNRSDTIKSINAMRDFIEAETSTVAGLSKMKHEAAQTFAANFDISIEDTAKLADVFKFAREEENKKYHVDSGTVAIARASQGKSNRDYLKTLRNYGYVIKDQRTREFYYSIRDKISGIGIE